MKQYDPYSKIYQYKNIKYDIFYIIRKNNLLNLFTNDTTHFIYNKYIKSLLHIHITASTNFFTYKELFNIQHLFITKLLDKYNNKTESDIINPYHLTRNWNE